MLIVGLFKQIDCISFVLFFNYHALHFEWIFSWTLMVSHPLFSPLTIPDDGLLAILYCRKVQNNGGHLLFAGVFDEFFEDLLANSRKMQQTQYWFHISL